MENSYHLLTIYPDATSLEAETFCGHDVIEILIEKRPKVVGYNYSAIIIKH